MAQDTFHAPVFEREIVDLFAGQPAGVVVDATLGGGGHAVALLAAHRSCDSSASTATPTRAPRRRARLAAFADRVRIVDADLRRPRDRCARQADFLGADAVVGVLMDLGVSSHQLDDASRGFSFRADAPLDMRMDPTTRRDRRPVPGSRRRRTSSCGSCARTARVASPGRSPSPSSSASPRRPTSSPKRSSAPCPMAARRRGHVATRVFQAAPRRGQRRGGRNWRADSPPPSTRWSPAESLAVDLVPLGRGPRRQGLLRRGGDRRVPLPARTRLRLRRRARVSVLQGQCSSRQRRGDRPQPSRTLGPPARRAQGPP